MVSGLVSMMKISILIELALDNLAESESLEETIQGFQVSGFVWDTAYEPVRMESGGINSSGQTMIIHGWVDSSSVIEQLRKNAKVVEVWGDTNIAPMNDRE